MFKVIILSFFFSLSSLYAQIDSEKLEKLNVEALLVKDISSNRLIYEKEANKKIYPASLTKIMTSMLAIEQGQLSRPVVITEEMLQVEPTKAGYKEGEIYFLDDLVKAALIHSDNDAAMAVAIAVGGTLENFIRMMNDKAVAIGMTNTLFTNPCGFDIGDHHSTPNDLLVLAEYSIKNPVFNAMTRLNQHSYYSLNTFRQMAVKTHNKLLDEYEYAVGVKTGYTSKAGPCLIARAQKEGKDCLIVMLNSKENRWKIAKEIFEQVFISEPEIVATLEATKVQF